MRAIQDELGVTEDVEDEIEGFRTKLEELQLEEQEPEKKSRRRSAVFPRCSHRLQRRL